MEPRDHSEHGEHERHDSTPEGEIATENTGPAAPPQQKQSRKSQAGEDEDAEKVQSHTKQGRDHDRDESGDSKKQKPGQSGQNPSLTRTLLLSGLVGLVCGVVGAWGYWHFFGSSKSEDQKSSEKSSESSQEDSSKGKLQQAEAAWKAAIKELHQKEAAERAALSSAEETKAVLDFLKKTLLSAGRPGDVSLPQAFWAGGQGKDIPLSKAMDAAESQVTEAFVERPQAEASVREMLGLGYLSVGEAAKAVKQYERAFALREAMQGASHPETAACRNQLAVAYRLAGRTAEASDLFQRNPISPVDAAALAVRGSMLLLQKKPVEAELKLRASLTIRQKIQPDDWTTFETESLLGEALLDQRKFGDAEPLLLSGYEGMKQREDTIPSRDQPRLTEALERLVKLYEAWGKQDKAVRWRKELEATEAMKKTGVSPPAR